MMIEIERLPRSLLPLLMLCLLLLLSCGGGEPQPEESVEVAPTEEVEVEVETEASADENAGSAADLGTDNSNNPDTELVVEQADVAEPRAEDPPIGEITVNYPPRMHLDSNEVINVVIHGLEEALTLDPTYQKIETSSDGTVIREVGRTESHTANIEIAEFMIAVVESDIFTLNPQHPPVQRINLSNPNRETVWVWELADPERIGQHKIFVRVYRTTSRDASDITNRSPSWVGSVTVDVIERAGIATAVPQVTADPGDNPSSVIWIGGVVFVLVVIGAVLFFTQQNRPPTPPVGGHYPGMIGGGPSDIETEEQKLASEIKDFIKIFFVDEDERQSILSSSVTPGQMTQIDFDDNAQVFTNRMVNRLAKKPMLAVLNELTHYTNQEKIQNLIDRLSNTPDDKWPPR